jgi:hypothetical protein
MKNHKLERLDMILCTLFLFVLLPFCTIVGTVAAVKSMVDQWNEGGASSVFSC